MSGDANFTGTQEEWDALVKKNQGSGQVKKNQNFGQAIEALKAGKRVAREGWNGKGMWLALSVGTPALPAENFWNPHNKQFAIDNGGTAEVLSVITMKTADGKILMGWLASQTDMLAEDWTILD